MIQRHAYVLAVPDLARRARSIASPGLHRPRNGRSWLADVRQGRVPHHGRRVSRRDAGEASWRPFVLRLSRRGRRRRVSRPRRRGRDGDVEPSATSHGACASSGCGPWMGTGSWSAPDRPPGRPHVARLSGAAAQGAVRILGHPARHLRRLRLAGAVRPGHGDVRRRRNGRAGHVAFGAVGSAGSGSSASRRLARPLRGTLQYTRPWLWFAACAAVGLYDGRYQPLMASAILALAMAR